LFPARTVSIEKRLPARRRIEPTHQEQNMSKTSIKRILAAVAGAGVIVALMMNHAAEAKGHRVAHSCRYSCNNGDCEVQRDDGKFFNVQVDAQYDSFSNTWVYPAPSCPLD
jgi:hypothetical protein